MPWVLQFVAPCTAFQRCPATMCLGLKQLVQRVEPVQCILSVHTATVFQAGGMLLVAPAQQNYESFDCKLRSELEAM